MVVGWFLEDFLAGEVALMSVQDFVDGLSSPGCRDVQVVTIDEGN